jgi:hypothetical protein
MVNGEKVRRNQNLELKTESSLVDVYFIDTLWSRNLKIMSRTVVISIM